MEKAVKTIGFLGFGEMASAIAAGWAAFCPEVKSGEIALAAYAPHTDKLKARTASLPVTACETAAELAEASDILVLAVKPDQVKPAVCDIVPLLDGKAVFSVVNAWSFAMLKEVLGEGVRVLRMMPNTPAQVGEGVFLLAEENDLNGEEAALARRLFSCLGQVIDLPEKHFSAASAISGCGPAFLYMVIEALGDAGVKNGLKRKAAYELAAQTLVGAGKMVLSGEGHPGALKDAVCSPGGTTIRGVAALEEAGMRSAFIKAVDAALTK